jgi:hypothetical protein
MKAEAQNAGALIPHSSFILLMCRLGMGEPQWP